MSAFLGRKLIEVAHDGGSKYHIPVDDAKRLVASGQANWAGPKSITLKASTSKRGIWTPRQSGYAGPLVLQFE